MAIKAKDFPSIGFAIAVSDTLEGFSSTLTPSPFSHRVSHHRSSFYLRIISDTQESFKTKMVLSLISLIRQVRADLKLKKSDRPEKVILYFDDKLRKEVKRALTYHHGRCDLPKRVMKVLLKSQSTKAAIAKGITTRPILDDDDLRHRLQFFFHWVFTREFVWDLVHTKTIPDIWWQCEVNHQAKPASLSSYSILFVLQLAVNEVCEEYLQLLEKKEPASAAKIVRRCSSSSSLELVRDEFRWRFQGFYRQRSTSAPACLPKQT